MNGDKEHYINLFNIEYNPYDFRIKFGKKRSNGDDMLDEDLDLILNASPVFIKEFAIKLMNSVSTYEKTFSTVYTPTNNKLPDVVSDQGKANE